MNYMKCINNASYFEILLKIDEDIASETQKKGCQYCGGKLDCANFKRKGYGFSEDFSEDLKIRFSFCCREDTCRKRETSASVRFLYRCAYPALWVLLVAALKGKSTKSCNELATQLKVSRQTVDNWVRWWSDVFADSKFWQVSKAKFSCYFNNKNIPEMILSEFLKNHKDVKELCEAVMRFLAPYHPNYFRG